MLKHIFILIVLSCFLILTVGFKKNDVPNIESVNCIDSTSYEVYKPISQVLGVTHVGGKYHFTEKPFLREGADTIKYLGTKVIKLWFSRTSSSVMQEAYYYNSTWPTNIRSLKELAQTTYFKEIFNMPFSTYILEAMDVGASYWKNGMSAEKQLAVQNEFYDLTKYLLQTYKNTGKTFILQNWEGDNALNAELIDSLKLHLAIDGMINWCNARQDGVTKARNEVSANGVLVAHCYEMNLVLPNPGTAATNIFVVDSVVPHTNSDLYSLSSWGTRTPGEEVKLTEKLNYIAARAPDSKLYGRKNVMLGEFGQYELSGWDAALPFNDQSGELQRISIENQIKYATDWGVPYLLCWEIFCNGLRNGITYNNGDVLQNNQLKGVWLIRADGTYTPTWNYFRSLFTADKAVKTQRPFDIQNYTSIIEVKSELLALKVTPNPTQGMIEISYPHKKIVSVHFFDINGNLCLNQDYVDSSFDIRQFPKGIYILTVTLKDKSIVSSTLVKY
jgi:hypothetical protein